MAANYTDITVLLDRSGSMETIQMAMEGGFTEFINGHKTNPTTRITLVQFDGENPYDVVYLARPITDVPKLALKPRGWTPLYDAVCTSIDATGRRLREMKEDDRPERVLFVIITDGLENNSKSFTQGDVKRRIKTQGEDYNWQFTYLGANQNALLEASKMGIDWTKSITFDANTERTRGAMRGLVRNTVAYASTGAASSLSYDDSQRSAASATPDLTIAPETE